MRCPPGSGTRAARRRQLHGPICRTVLQWRIKFSQVRGAISQCSCGSNGYGRSPAAAGREGGGDAAGRACPTPGLSPHLEVQRADVGLEGHIALLLDVGVAHALVVQRGRCVLCLDTQVCGREGCGGLACRSRKRAAASTESGRQRQQKGGGSVNRKRATGSHRSTKTGSSVNVSPKSDPRSTPRSRRREASSAYQWSSVRCVQNLWGLPWPARRGQMTSGG